MEDSINIFIDWGVRITGALLILAAGWMIGNWTGKRIRNIKKLDDMLGGFLGGLAKYAILSVSLITVLAQFGVQTTSLIAVLGTAGLAIGLALQGTLSNVASGVMLLILRPFKVGDYIQFGADGGTVKELGLFTTELSTPDNVAIFAPNSAIFNAQIYNYSRHGQRRQDIVAGISYDDDIGKAIAIIQKVLDSEDRVLTTKGKEPMVVTSGMGESSIELTLRFWCKSDDYWTLKWDLTKAVKEALVKGGITIPFPTRTLQITREGETVKKAAA